LKALFGCLGFVVFLIVLSINNGLLISIAWGTIITRVFEIRSITLVEAWALGVFIGFFRAVNLRPEKKSTEQTITDTFGVITAQWVTLAIMVAVMYWWG
jgi:hypothetical protein